MKFKNYLSNLSYKLTDGQIDRRQFVMSALAAGVALPSALGMADMAAAATPKKGGRLRIGVTGGATTDTLDPGQILDMYMINVQFGQTRNNLTVVGSDGLLQPELAEEWGASADASVWTFKIRSGVEFHNGKTLSVEDVVDSLNHHLGEESKSAAKGILSGIDSVKADGKNHVAVALKGGNADFPFMLSDYHVNMCPSNGDGTIDWQSGVGTGGYMIAEHDPGVRTLTKRNPNYWKDGAAHFDECETIQIGDTFSGGRKDRFIGVPHFAPELFRRVRLKDPLKSKQLRQGLTQLSEEGATQVFMPLTNNDLILGAVGVLQFDVVAYRLKDEYKVDCGYESVAVNTARWVVGSDPKQLEEFKRKAEGNLAVDGGGHLTYLAPSRVNLSLMEERWPSIEFRATREIA